ncbi:MAG: response regulator [Celeribacter sp.]|jgi:CheY-like chemotaxis protein
MKTILLAEDSSFSIREFKRKLEHCTFEADLIVVRDGQAAIDLLDPDSPTALASLPDLVVLDLKMPRIEGLDVLAWIRQSDTLHDLPVIVLTTSDAFFDMDMAGALDVGEYLTKDAPAATLCAALTRNLSCGRKRLDPFHDILREFTSEADVLRDAAIR